MNRMITEDMPEEDPKLAVKAGLEKIVLTVKRKNGQIDITGSIDESELTDDDKLRLEETKGKHILTE